MEDPKPLDPLLVRRAIVLAWITIGYNVVEGVVAMGFGWADDSVALFGFGADSWIEVASALVVLWRFRSESGRGHAISLERERTATASIGLLFLLLAAGTAFASLAQLWRRGHPETTLPGVVVALVSIGIMAWLWTAKRRLAHQLDSATLEKDAACSRACMQLSAVLLAGSLLDLVAPSLWWGDSVAALALAALIGREGVGMVAAARRHDFAGGCGCSHD